MKTNLFKEGDKVKWLDKTGKILRNDRDFRCWVVEFPGCTLTLHYRDLELIF